MYDHDLIEMKLIDVIQNRSVGMVIQDLKCIKCQGVSVSVCITSVCVCVCVCLNRSRRLI